MNYEEFVKNNPHRSANEDINSYYLVEKFILNNNINDEDKKPILELFSALKYWIGYSQAAEESLREERFDMIDLQEKMEDIEAKHQEKTIIIKTMVNFLSNCENKCQNSESLKKIEFMSELIDSHIPME